MSRFPDDYPIETLQGGHRPGHQARLRVLARRIAWLCSKITMFPERARDTGASHLVAELATLAIVVEMIEDRFPNGAPQRFTAAEIEILRTLVVERVPHLHDGAEPKYQSILTKITDIQTSIALRAEKE